MAILQVPHLLILGYAVVATFSQPTWRMEPKDTIALKGDTVILTCIVGNRTSTSRSDQKLFWYQSDHNHRISRNMNILVADREGSQYTVHNDRALGIYTLVITNVGQRHGGHYQCIYREPSSNSEYFSDVITLNVLVPPTGGYKQCKVYPKSKLILSPTGTRVLSCASPFPVETDERIRQMSENTAVYHNWQVENAMVLHGFFLQNRTTLLSESGLLSGHPVSVKFCAINSLFVSLFPEFCRLVPIKKNIAAIVDPPSLVVSAGNDVSLRCSSNDMAAIVDYSWEFKGIFPSNGFLLRDKGHIISIKNIGYTDVQVKIMCHITTELGLQATATANITVVLDDHSAATLRPEIDQVGYTDDGQPGELGHISNKPDIKEFDPDNTIPKNISLLVGPGLGVLLLFIGALFLAACLVKWKRMRDKSEGSPAHLSQEAHAAVSLRTVNQNNSTASKRHLSESDACRVSRVSEEYENIEAYAEKLGEFSRGTSSFQLNSVRPMEANIKFKIELPQSLSTSMPALNLHGISSIANCDASHYKGTPNFATLRATGHSTIEKKSKSFNSRDAKRDDCYMPLSTIMTDMNDVSELKTSGFGRLGECY